MDDVLFGKIFKEHEALLKNLDIPHRPLAVGLAGIPGSGKTTVATLLEERYKGIRINNDQIRAVINRLIETKNVPPAEGEKTLQDYLPYCFTALNERYPNKLFILDSGLDRKYQSVKEWADKNGFPLFVISLETTPEEAMQRIEKRDPAEAPNYRRDMPRFMTENASFRVRVKPDIILHNPAGTAPLFAVLDKTIS